MKNLERTERYVGVEFVLGRTASKRDDYVMEKIGSIIRKDPLANVLVVVPPQATYITEKQLMHKLGLKGLMGAVVQSPARICDRVLESTYGRTIPEIDSVGKSMILRLILDGEQEHLEALAKSARKSDVPMELSGLIAELKTLDITPQMLLEIDTNHENTKKKLADIALLYERFEEKTAGLFDTEDKINLVIEHIPEAEFLKGAHLVIHGFDIYNAQTVRFLKALIHAAKDTTMSFYYAQTNAPDSGVYEICNENRNKFLQDAIKMGLKTTIITEDREISKDILHLEKNLYAYPARHKERAKDISVTSAPDVDEEVRAVAAQIVWLNRKYGYNYRDMAVVCGSGERYSPVIRRRFAEAGIPCFTGEKRTLAQCAFSMFLLTALELAQGRLKKDTLLAHARTGFCDLREEQADALENYAYCNVRDGFAFGYPFKEPRAERARLRLMEPVTELREAAKGAKDADSLIGCVLAYMQRLHVDAKLAEQTKAAREAGLLQSAEWNGQVFDKTMRILTQAREILKDTQAGKGQILSLLKTGLTSQKIGVIPPGADEVAVGDVSYIRLDDVKAVFVVGANDGLLPNYEQPSDILADYERELLLSQLAGLQFTGNVEKQKLAIQKIVTKPKEKLFFSYVDDGREKPSPLIDKLGELFGAVKQNRAADIAPLLKQNAYAQAARIVRGLADGTVEEYDRKVVAAVLADDTLPEKQRAIRRGVMNANAAARLNADIAAALYGEMKGSASRLEQYFECPYKHFIAYGLNVEQPREYVIDQLDVGNYAHKILEELTNTFKEKQTRWADVPEEEFVETLKACAGTAREEQSKYTLNRHNENVLALVEREVGLAAHAIRTQTGRASLQPAESEYWFSQEFTDGLTINGKIDRIDTAVIDGTLYFDIVDYKTGDPQFKLLKLASGLSLQLMIYIIAVRELLGNGAEFAGANYLKIHLPSFEEEGKDVDGEFDMEGICGVDFDTAQKLYGGEGDIVLTIAIERKKDGSVRKNAQDRLFSPDEVEELVAFTKKLIGQAVLEMKQGNTQIMPYRLEQRMGCDYCEFASICMYDEGYTGNHPREIEKLTREQAMEKISGHGEQV